MAVLAVVVVVVVVVIVVVVVGLFAFYEICRAANKHTHTCTRTHMQNKFATSNYWKSVKFSGAHEKIFKNLNRKIEKKPSRKTVEKLPSQQQANKMYFHVCVDVYECVSECVDCAVVVGTKTRFA